MTTVHLAARCDYKPRPYAGYAPPAAFAPAWPRVVSNPSLGWIEHRGPLVEVRGVFVGGFDTQSAADHWKRAVDAHPNKVMTTAGDLFIGKWSGEIRVLVPCMYNGWRWGEIWDIGCNTDNGHVLFCSVRDRWVHPDTVVLLDDAEQTVESRERDSLMVSEAPPLLELGDEHIPDRRTLTRHPKGGQLQVVEDYSCNNVGGLMLIWRRDARRKWAHGLSVHDTADAAKAAMGWFATQWEPPPADLQKAGYDRQKQKVYDWEARIERAYPMLRETLTFEECVTLATQASQPFSAPKVVFADKLDRCCYYRAGVIRLADWGRRRGTLLHETAHHVTQYSRVLGSPRDEAHGPRFLGIYMRLLNLHAGIPYDIMIEEANQRGLEHESLP